MASILGSFFRRVNFKNLSVRYLRLNQNYGTLDKKNLIIFAMFAPFAANGLYYVGKNCFLNDTLGTYIHQLSRDNVAVPYPDKVIDQITDEMNKCDLIWPVQDDPRRHMGSSALDYKFSISNDFDPHTIGIVNHIAKNGAVIMLPYYIMYDKPSDVEKDFPKLKLFKKHFFDRSNEFSLNWSNKFAERLRKCLVLSPDAKSYLIRRELRKANDNNMIMIMMLILVAPGFVSAVIYDSLYKLNKKIRLRFYEKHCIAIAGILAILSIAVRNIAKRYYEVECEKSFDLNPIRSESYKRGAIEYFEKSLERNKLLRELLGDKGRKLFDADGNDRSHLADLPLTKRLNYVKNCNVETQLKIDPSSQLF